MFRILTASLVVFYTCIHVDSAPLKTDYTRDEFGFSGIIDEARDGATTHETGQDSLFGALSDDQSDVQNQRTMQSLDDNRNSGKFFSSWDVDGEQNKNDRASVTARLSPQIYTNKLKGPLNKDHDSKFVDDFSRMLTKLLKEKDGDSGSENLARDEQHFSHPGSFQKHKQSESSGQNDFFGDMNFAHGHRPEQEVQNDSPYYTDQFQPSSKNNSAYDQSGFETNTKDCANIDTKSCSSDDDCSCHGFYVCAAGNCRTSSPTQQTKENAGGVWGTPFDNNSLGGTVDGVIDDGTKGTTNEQSINDGWGFLGKK